MQDDDTTVFSFGERADELMTALSAALGVSDSIIKRWRSNGFIHPRQVKKIRDLYRGMGVAA